MGLSRDFCLKFSHLQILSKSRSPLEREQSASDEYMKMGTVKTAETSNAGHQPVESKPDVF